jgi:hypothetical protein
MATAAKLLILNNMTMISLVHPEEMSSAKQMLFSIFIQMFKGTSYATKRRGGGVCQEPSYDRDGR